MKRLIVVFACFVFCFTVLYLRIGGIALTPEYAQAGKQQGRYMLRFGETRAQIYDCGYTPLMGQTSRTLYAVLPKGKPYLTTVPPQEGENARAFQVANREEQIAAHLIGYTVDGKGVCGLEKAYDSFLAQESRQSTITYTLNGMGYPLEGIPPQVNLAPEQTAGIVLTIDKKIQEIAEQAGAAFLQKGAVVVMEIATGDLKAVASFPSYRVENLTDAVADKENSPLFNRAFAAYNVGSVFKIATCAAALEQGIDPKTSYRCTGAMAVDAQRFHCHNRSGHGLLQMQSALQASCNPFFIHLAGKIPDQAAFRTLAQRMSFGKANTFGNGFSTAAGNLTSLSALSLPAEYANFAFGQGKLLATPIQVTQMTACIANGGITPTASLVQGITQDGATLSQIFPKPAKVRATSPATAKTLQSMLTACVMDTPHQQAKPTAVTAGGKTSTAQTGKFDADGKEHVQTWFTGFFPAEQPQYAVTVLCEDGENGNQSAAPTFRRIADRMVG